MGANGCLLCVNTFLASYTNALENLEGRPLVNAIMGFQSLLEDCVEQAGPCNQCVGNFLDQLTDALALPGVGNILPAVAAAVDRVEACLGL
ncbi:hypothetical protein R4Z10_10410 [Niallia sp. XMNu-256]|uniref:hypothetical protein n=1 Tax=Niallia sp. XMNu-256 TaxID=3082444 RepID=UPI0030CFFD72